MAAERFGMSQAVRVVNAAAAPARTALREDTRTVNTIRPFFGAHDPPVGRTVAVRWERRRNA
ncbi:hypothetical protein GCM10027610_137500 [Dactylosporangium cerinum]